MTDVDRAAKLAMIARMTADELRGWQWALRSGAMGREPFEGEAAALADRAKRLGAALTT